MVLFTLTMTVCIRTCLVSVCGEHLGLQDSLFPLCRARAATVCMCLCQHDGGEGSYSDLMNPSAFRGHSSSRMQTGANKQQPGSPSSGLPVQRFWGGDLDFIFPEQTGKDTCKRSTKFPRFISPSWNPDHSQREGGGCELYSQSRTLSSVLYSSVPSCFFFSFLFTVRTERS